MSNYGVLNKYIENNNSDADEKWIKCSTKCNKDNVKSNRHWMLHKIKNDLLLSSPQARVEYPTNEYEHARGETLKFKAEPLLEDFPAISLPLPLPDVPGEWGVANLFLKFKASSLLVTLNLILLESSVLVIGTSPEEVASCTSALLTLLQPFTWASVFIPQIPLDYLDFVSSPVPFIAGLIVEGSSNLNQILNDNRVKNAVSDGMIILSLSTGDVISDNAAGKEKIIAFSQTLLM